MFEKKPEKKIWVINKGLPIDHINVKLKKHIFLRTNIPLQFPMGIAMETIPGGSWGKVQLFKSFSEMVKHLSSKMGKNSQNGETSNN